MPQTDTATMFKLDLWEVLCPAILFSSLHMVEHTLAQHPLEAVGVLTLEGGLRPLINQARSSERFTVSKQLMEEAVQDIVSSDQTPYALYHSHPKGSPEPSTSDCDNMRLAPKMVSVIHGARKVDDGQVHAFAAHRAVTSDPSIPTEQIGEVVFDGVDFPLWLWNQPRPVALPV